MAVSDRLPAKRTVHRAVGAVAALAGVAGLVVVVDPRAVIATMGHLDARALVPIVLLVLLFYGLQGLRWHLLLRSIGAQSRLSDSQLINLAGQAVTAVLPLGDLTRAVMASKRTGVTFGSAAATVTVQELTFMLLVVAAAAPGLDRLPYGHLWMLVVVAGLGSVAAVLTLPRFFAAARRPLAATALTRRFLDDIDALQRDVRRLLARPAVLAGSVLDLGRVIAATAALLLTLRALHINTLTWWDVALVLAVSFVGGALSFLPGGVGANEASVVGVLILLGVNPAAAAAVAILQRLELTAVPAVAGMVSYAVLCRRGAVISGRPHRIDADPSAGSTQGALEGAYAVAAA